MGPQKSSELAQAIALLRPYVRRAFWFSLVGSLLVLAPTGFMLEVYDRVVNSRSHLTLLMLLLAGAGRLRGDGTARVGARADHARGRAGSRPRAGRPDVPGDVHGQPAAHCRAARPSR